MLLWQRINKTLYIDNFFQYLFHPDFGRLVTSKYSSLNPLQSPKIFFEVLAIKIIIERI